jgi:hypothetical protein
VRHLLRTIGGDLIEPIDQFGIASTFLDHAAPDSDQRGCIYGVGNTGIPKQP